MLFYFITIKIERIIACDNIIKQNIHEHFIIIRLPSIPQMYVTLCMSVIPFSSFRLFLVSFIAQYSFPLYIISQNITYIIILLKTIYRQLPSFVIVSINFVIFSTIVRTVYKNFLIEKKLILILYN